MLKGQNGVTLISLVVTIIVLLILTGVSLSMVLGQNGVLTQASTAVVEQTKADVTEKVATALTSIETEYKGAWAQDTSTKRSEYYTADRLAEQFTGDVRIYAVDEALKDKEVQVDITLGSDDYKDMANTSTELDSQKMYLVMLTEGGANSFALVAFTNTRIDNAPTIAGEKQSRTAGSTYVSYIDVGDEEVAEFDEDTNKLTIKAAAIKDVLIDFTPTTTTTEGN